MEGRLLGQGRVLWLLVATMVLPWTAKCFAEWNPERWIPESAEEVDIDALINSYAREKIDVNRAARSALDGLDLFASQEIEVILAHRPWASVDHVVAALNLDAARAEITREILFAGKTDAGDRVRVESRAGWNESAVRLRDVRIAQRVRGHILPSVTYGFVQERDPGEPAVGDHLAGHIEIRGPGILRHVIIGDYVLRWGQGLIFWPDGPTRLAVSGMERSSQGGRAFSGTSEGGFLRGGFAEAVCGSWDFLGFVSRRRLDARIDDEGRVTGFPVTGYHRTEKEIRERHRALEQMAGARVAWCGTTGVFGMTWARVSYSPDVRLGDPGRDGVRFEGAFLQFASLDGALRRGHRTLFGEVVLGPTPSVVLGVTERQETVEWVLGIRYLDRSLYSPYGSLPMVRRSALRNEEGGFLAVRVRPRRTVSLCMAADLESRPWRTWSQSVPRRRQELRFDVEGSFRSLRLTAEWKATVSPYLEHKENLIVRRALRMCLEPRRGWTLSCDLKESESGGDRGTLGRASLSIHRRRWKARGTVVVAWLEPGAPSLYAYSGSLPGEVRFMQASRSGQGYSVTLQVCDVQSVGISVHYEVSRFISFKRWCGVLVDERF